MCPALDKDAKFAVYKKLGIEPLVWEMNPFVEMRGGRWRDADEEDNVWSATAALYDHRFRGRGYEPLIDEGYPPPGPIDRRWLPDYTTDSVFVIVQQPVGEYDRIMREIVARSLRNRYVMMSDEYRLPSSISCPNITPPPWHLEVEGIMRVCDTLSQALARIPRRYGRTPYAVFLLEQIWDFMLSRGPLLPKTKDAEEIKEEYREHVRHRRRELAYKNQRYAPVVRFASKQTRPCARTHKRQNWRHERGSRAMQKMK